MMSRRLRLIGPRHHICGFSDEGSFLCLFVLPLISSFAANVEYSRSQLLILVSIMVVFASESVGTHSDDLNGEEKGMCSRLHIFIRIPRRLKNRVWELGGGTVIHAVSDK